MAETRISARFPSWFRLGREGIIVGLMLLGLLLRACRLGAQSLWFDEAYTAAIAGMPLREGLRALIADGVHPPFFYLLESGMLTFGGNEIWLRLPSLLAGVAAIPLLYELGRKWVGPRAGLLASALIALSPYHIWYSQDARMYALLGTLSILSMVFYDRLLERPSPWGFAGFGLTNALAYLTHYFAFFLPIIQLAHLVIHLRRHWRLLRSWAVTQALAAVPALLWVIAIAGRDAQIFGIGWIPTPVIKDLPLTLMNFTMGVPAQVRLIHWVLLVFALAAAGMAIRAKWTEPDRKTLALIWCFLPLAATFLISFRRAIYIDRFLIVSLGAWVLLLAAGAAQWKGKRFALATAVLIGVFVFGLIQVNWTDRQTKEQWREAAEYLGTAGEDEIIVTRVLQMAVPLRYYYAGKAPIEPLQVNRDLGSLSEITKGFDGAWLVYWNASADAHLFAAAPQFDPSSETAPEMKAWISGYGPPLTVRVDFQGVTMLHFQLADGR
jgi:mannosyltransferase